MSNEKLDHPRCESIIKIENMIIGNGVPGIAKLIATHEIYIQQQRGLLYGLKWFLGIFSLSNIALLAKLVFKI